jgi:serine/threonine-protein kinase
VVRVLAEGEERGFCWYAMERVDGPDLRTKLADGPLPAPEVEGLARRVLSALGAAHARGFIHRDVKPSNLLLAKDGAKLCDFGIARLDGATTLTATAALIGSLRYMAPEQQRLGRADARSDLYALGLVLYEALAGGIPGERPLPPGVPRRLRTLLARLLAENPSARPVSAEAALKLLDRRVPVGVLSVGGAAVLALTAFLVMGPGFAGKATKVEATPKDVAVRAQQQKEPLVEQGSQEGGPVQKNAPAFSEPQKLPEPTVTKKTLALEAPTPLPDETPPQVQSKTLPTKLINSTTLPPKGTPKQKRGKAPNTEFKKQ